LRPLRLRETTVIAVGFVGLLGAGCVQPSSPGVSVSPLKADIVFGVKDVVETPAPPPNFAPAPVFFDDEPLLEDDSFDQKVLEIPQLRPIPTTPTAAAAPNPCPPAALTAFPAKIAEVHVDGMPKEGVYKFKRTLSATPTGGETATLEGYEQRVIRNIKPTAGSDHEFSYEVLQPDNFNPGKFIVTTFRVNTNPAIIKSVEQAPQTVGVVPVPGAEAIVTPPQDEPGIFVDRFEYLNKDGSRAGTFEPVRPLKYLPLDEGIVRPGQTFDTVGIDATTGTVIRHQGTVLRKTRVDACGDVVEGWLVEAVQTSTDDLVERRYFYNVATQYGSLFIAENVTASGSDGTGSVDLSLADIDPEPLPDNLR
jgi:hypothetical protein